jgi:transcription antitermination factor NusG
LLNNNNNNNNTNTSKKKIIIEEMEKTDEATVGGMVVPQPQVQNATAAAAQQQQPQLGFGFQIKSVSTKKRKELEANIQPNSKSRWISSFVSSSSSSSSSSLLGVRNLIVVDDEDDENRVKAPLVIPLQLPRNVQPPPPQPTKAAGSVAGASGGGAAVVMKLKEIIITEESTLEERAAAELLKSLHDKRTEIAESKLCIPLAGQVTGDESDNHVGSAANTTVNRMPLLQANLAPELAGIANDDERFKVDISLRADDMNVRSSAYKDVPIEEFGAAMLRGMGWSGPTKEDEEFSKTLNSGGAARVFRLGLGALALPPELKKDGKKMDKKQEEALKQEWQKKVADKIAKQSLADGDYVWLRDPKYASKRAKVINTRGVPGLNRIRVALESSGEVVEVKKTDSVLLSAAELEEAPFLEPAAVPGNVGGTATDSRSRSNDNCTDSYEQLRLQKADEVGRNRSNRDRSNRDRDRSRSREKERTMGRTLDRDRDHDKTDRERDRYREQDCDRERARDSGSREARDGNRNSQAGHFRTKDQVSSNGADQDRKPIKQDFKASADGVKGSINTDHAIFRNWLRNGIRVRIISEKVGGSKAHLQKGWVMDVYSQDRATVKLDSGKIIQEVKEKYLETVLPTVGNICMVLNGPYKNQTVTLLEKNKETEKATVQLAEELDVIFEISMNFIAAYSAN